MTGTLAGHRYTPDPSVEVRSEGRVLLGGSPLRVVRLTPGGAEVARLVLDGEPVPPGRGPTALVRRLLDGGLVHPRTDAAGVASDRSEPTGPARLAARVTVVVPVLGQLDPQLLAGVSGTAEVIVVDDASPVPVEVPATTPDGTPVRVVRRDAQGGPGAARNTGLAQVTTPLVAFVDADCTPDPGWIDALLPHFDDPDVTVAAPRIVTSTDFDGDRTTGALARYESARSALDMGPAAARVRARSRVSFVPAAALVARVCDLREVGGFDEALRVGEDVDLVWRLDETGRTVRYEPSVTVGHRHRPTLRSWARRRFDYGTSAGPLARRHPGALVPAEASPWTLAAWVLTAAGHPVVGTALAGITAAPLARRLADVEDATPLAVRVAARAHLAAGRMLATAVVRPWWPAALLAALVVPSRRLRRTVLLAALVPPLVEWAADHPSHGPVSYVGLRLADDLAYSSGVWVGAWRARTAEPLVPDLTSWPRPSRYSAWRAERT